MATLLPESEVIIIDDSSDSNTLDFPETIDRVEQHGTTTSADVVSSRRARASVNVMQSNSSARVRNDHGAADDSGDDLVHAPKHPRLKSLPWTEGEKAKLVEMCREGWGMAAMTAALPGRTRASVEAKRKHLVTEGLLQPEYASIPASIRDEGRSQWTKAEDDTLRRLRMTVPVTAWDEIAAALPNRTSRACQNRYFRLPPCTNIQPSTAWPDSSNIETDSSNDVMPRNESMENWRNSNKSRKRKSTGDNTQPSTYTMGYESDGLLANVQPKMRRLYAEKQAHDDDDNLSNASTSFTDMIINAKPVTIEKSFGDPVLAEEINELNEEHEQLRAQLAQREEIARKKAINAALRAKVAQLCQSQEASSRSGGSVDGSGVEQPRATLSPVSMPPQDGHDHSTLKQG